MGVEVFTVEALPATLTVDLSEAEVVLCAAAKPGSFEVSAEPVSNFVDTRLERLVVVDLLIVADIGCLSLVADLLQSLLALQTIDATAMGRYVDGIGSAETAKVFLLEKVAHTYPSAQAEITEIHVDLTLCIRWIVDHKHTVGTLRPVDIVLSLMRVISQPMSSGEFIAHHIPKCVLSSSAVMLRPTSSISMSL